MVDITSALESVNDIRQLDDIKKNQKFFIQTQKVNQKRQELCQ